VDQTGKTRVGRRRSCGLGMKNKIIEDKRWGRRKSEKRQITVQEM
jgi:hypothetical protein